VTFSAPGTYFYGCNIHPGMVGWIHVTESGDVSDYNSTDIEEWIAADDAVTYWYDQSFALGPYESPQAHSWANFDGTRTWANRIGQVAPNSRGDGMLEYFRFSPSVMEIERGDSVAYFFTSVHALGFSADLEYLFTASTEEWLGLPVEDSGVNFVPRAKTNQKISSGILPFGQTFVVKFGEAGVFPYICSLHLPSGMNGTVAVKSHLPKTKDCKWSQYWSENAKKCKNCAKSCSVCDGPGINIGNGGCLECNQDNGYWLSSNGRECVTECAEGETLVDVGLVWQCLSN